MIQPGSKMTFPVKLLIGLERISQAFKVLLWNKAKEYGLSPIQIQILIFVAHHKSEYNNVSGTGPGIQRDQTYH